MKTRRWLVVLVTAIALAVLGTGAVLAAPWAQEAPPPEGTTPEAALARGFVGAAVRDLNEKLLERLGLPEGTTGVVVTHVLPHGPAREAGLQSRDVITAVDGEPIAAGAALRQALAGKAQGDSVTLTVLRDGEEQTISLTLGETPVRPHEGKSAPKFVDGEFRVLKDDALVTIRVAAGTVVAVEGDTLTIEKETPDQEQVSFTITGDTKVFDKGKAVELSALVGKQVVVTEEDGVVKRVQAGPFRTHPKQHHPFGRAGVVAPPGIQGGPRGNLLPPWVFEQVERNMEGFQQRLQELRERMERLNQPIAPLAGQEA